MNVYKYTAIITKDRVVHGKTTYTTKRHFEPVALDSVVVVGHVLGESLTMAEVNATKELKKRYPEELGYDCHERVRVEQCEETVVNL